MASSPGGISSRHAPALDLPARFMVVGMAALAVAALLSPWAYRLLPGGFYAPHLLAFVHLNTLGVIAAVVVGASYQLVPVVLQTPLASVRLARLSFWLYLVGLVLFLPGIAWSWHPALASGAAFVFTGLLVYLLVIAWTLRRAPRLDMVGWHIALAQAGLGAGIAAGMLLAANKGTGYLGSMTFRILAAHATLMLGAWVAVMLSGVAYRLVGMFTLTEDRLWHRVAWVELALTVAGAWSLAGGLLAGAGRGYLATASLLIVGGQALFAVQLVHLYGVRRRRGFDVHIPYAVLAAGSGLLAALLLTGGTVVGAPLGSRIWVAVGWLAIAGLALTAIQGFFYKITTFLVWLHRYAPLAGRRKVPRLEQMYGRRLAQAGWGLWGTGLALSTAGIGLGSRPLSQVAGVVALAGLGCFLTNVARVASHWRPIASEVLRRAARESRPEFGKEEHAS
jgi:hypothetical protein